MELEACEGFDWDEGNPQKNWVKHQVTPFECEHIFFNHPLITAPDQRHSGREARFYALGRTDAGRLLFAAFTLRNKMVRVISARDMSRREKEAYKNHEE